MSTALASNPRLPLPLAAAALVAMASHYVNGERFPGLVICAAVLLASYLTSWRIPRKRALNWTLRLIACGAVLAVVGLPKEELIYWYIKFEYTDRIGYLLAAELALRAWRRPDRARVTRDRGDILLLSALLIAASANTYDRRWMQMLAPVYSLFLLLSLPSLTPASRSEGSTRPGFAVLRGAAVAVALLIGFTSIYLITRYDRKLSNWAMNLLRAGQNRRSEIGLSSAPRLQAVFNPTASMTRMLLIEGPPGERHLRAIAYDTYDAGNWRRHPDDFSAVAPAQLRTPGVGRRLRVTWLGDTLEWLLLPLHTAAVETAGVVERDSNGALRTPDVVANPAYGLIVPTDERHQGPACVPPDGAARERLLKLPAEIDPKVIALAREVAREGDAATKLARIQLHLRSRHRYSLSFEPEGEPLSDFILNGRSAHCQYFASAVVIMARAAGVPARFVTGYYAHEPYGESRTVVRDRDAHAWAECWIDGAGWITLDATPAGGRPDALFPQPSRWQRLRERLQDLPAAARQWLAEVKPRTWIAVAAVIALPVPLVRLVRRLRLRNIRKPGRFRSYDPPAPDLIAVARRFERYLKRRRTACPSHRTWREHVRFFTTSSTACAGFVEAYDQARFGGATAQALSRLRELLQDLERQNV